MITYNSVVTACAKGGGTAKKALQLFAEMLQQGIQPNLITYNAVISACGNGGIVRRALQLRDPMRMAREWLEP